MSSPWRHPPLMRYKHDKLRIPNTEVILFASVSIKLSFYILTSFDMNQSHALLSITVLNTVYVYKCCVRIKNNHCRRLVFLSPVLTVPPPRYYRLDCVCARFRARGKSPRAIGVGPESH